jgi:hypothetical protein
LRRWLRLQTYTGYWFYQLVDRLIPFSIYRECEARKISEREGMGNKN